MALGAAAGDIRSVKLLGPNETLKWKRDSAGLRVELPEKPPCDSAYSLVIDYAAQSQVHARN
jgi:hypothetical protein